MKKIFFSFVLAFYGSTLPAQEGGKDINIDVNTKGGSEWYTSPWLWVVAAAVFILLLVALTRGGRRE